MLNNDGNEKQDSRMMLHSYLQGLSVALSLIIAIGAQNAFILKQGLKKQHIFWLCLICAVSDSILLAAGVFGFSYVVLSMPEAVKVAQILGAIFLLIYGGQHFYQAIFKTQQMDINPELTSQQSSEVKRDLQKLLLICLALTWLNPHVYLDTVVLVGSISTQFSEHKIEFLLGAITASWLFFFSLGYAARYLLPVFKSAISWKILDVIIGCVMWWIAYHLIF